MNNGDSQQASVGFIEEEKSHFVPIKPDDAVYLLFHAICHLLSTDFMAYDNIYLFGRVHDTTLLTDLPSQTRKKLISLVFTTLCTLSVQNNEQIWASQLQSSIYVA